MGGIGIKTTKERRSNLELFRIVTMVIIIMHHYVVNSGIIGQINSASQIGNKEIVMLLWGWGGKTGINCFVLITGYFMCTSSISAIKYAKLLVERYFYSIIIFFIFVVSGYIVISIKGIAEVLFPFFNINTNFTGCYLLFYLFIPFLNKLINVMTAREHFILLILCLGIYTILPSFLGAHVTFNYVTWFVILYFIGAFLRLHLGKWENRTKLWGVLSILILALSFGSVVCFTYLGEKLGITGLSYFFVADSNKILAVLMAISSFLFFNSIKIKQNSFINTIASSTFGVFLIHTNSDAMRQWLWKDVLKAEHYYQTSYFIIHAILSVVLIFSICTVIDQLRIKFVEIPLFKRIQKGKAK